MPSNKDPKSTVAAGPGKLPAGVVPASALLFPSGGGSGAALSAHINNPIDAHMASAIGIQPTYPLTGEPILASAGGPIDGEDVLDFINQMKDLLPVKPDYVGFNNIVPNSGIPNWGAIDTSLTGGFARGTNVIPSHYLFGVGTASFILSGMVFPADRGVLALYSNTDGNYFNAGATTLVAAIWLGSSPSPSGIPDSAFNQAIRTSQQTNYTATGVGLDQISLTNRLPYLSDYSGYGSPYTNFTTNFYAFQLATYSILAQALSSGDAGSYLLVHWRETYATSLATIQPASLTVGTLTAANCYSAVPSGSFDTGNVANVNRRNVFVDADSGTAPTGNSFSSSVVGTPSTHYLSGIQFYDNISALQWSLDIRVDGLFANSFQLGTIASPPNIPTGFTSSLEPMRLDTSDFGGTSSLLIPYYDLKPTGGSLYSITNAPQPADQAQYTNASVGIPGAVATTPVGGIAHLRADLYDPFNTVVYPDPQGYLFNSYAAGALSSSTYEPFVDEYHRYITSITPLGTETIVPAGGNIYNSAATLVGTADLQVIGHELVYPQSSFAGYLPSGLDYSGVPGGDGANFLRRYVRAFDTGIPRNTGKIRLRGLAQSAFASAGAYTGSEVNDHTGGAIVQIQVPGVTGWLDLGRSKGDPDLTTVDFHGCATGVAVSGSDVTVSYDTTSFTVNNGSGQYPIFVRVTFINGTGTALVCQEIEWLPP